MYQERILELAIKATAKTPISINYEENEKISEIRLPNNGPRFTIIEPVRIAPGYGPNGWEFLLGTELIATLQDNELEIEVSEARLAEIFGA